jgi:hypothetical protein
MSEQVPCHVIGLITFCLFSWVNHRFYNGSPKDIGQEPILKGRMLPLKQKIPHVFHR